MIKVAILGYGTVGSGVFQIIKENKELITNKAGQEIDIKYVLDLREFPGDPCENVLVHDYNIILNDPEVEVIIEVMGGLKPSYDFVKSALEAGKSVCTSNKELVAKYGAELIKIAQQHNRNFLFEAAVGGGIPIIRPLNMHITADKICEITGILNGTTNFILTLMERDNLDFEEALKIAQNLGYVEANAALDLDGYDAAHKIYILTMNAFGTFFDFDKIKCTGIRNVTKKDMDYAKKLGYRIKLIAMSKKLENGLGIDVSPTLVPMSEIVGNVMDAYNVVEITCDYLENVLFYGKGAGRYVTASAVVADIIKTAKKDVWTHDYDYTENVYPITSSKYYVRSEQPLNLNYDEYYSFGEDHIYITDEVELKDLEDALKDTPATYFKVRS